MSYQVLNVTGVISVTVSVTTTPTRDDIITDSLASNPMTDAEMDARRADLDRSREIKYWDEVS